MIGLIKAEFRKLFTTQVWFWMLLLSLGLTSLTTVGQILSSGDDSGLQFHVRDVFVSVVQAPAYVPLFILGVLSVTTEYRYQTITPTVLTTPSRWTLISAKLLSMALIGALYALLCVVVELGISLPWLSARHININLGGHLGALGAVFLVLALFALVGLGAGALLKNQIVAVSLGVAFILIIDNLVLVIPGVRAAYPYLLTGATHSIAASQSDRHDFNGVVRLISPGSGVAVLIAWGIGMALLGAGLTMNRDIT
jgi:ABC-2 type transport system permease protein